MNKATLIVTIFALASCADHVEQQTSVGQPEVGLGPPPDVSPPPPDYRIIDSSPAVIPPVDASPPDPCEEVTVDDHEIYCRCKPQCCEVQEWFCPPQPDNAIQSMQVTIETCDEDDIECEFGADPDCPPPQIIHRSDCQVTHECPPGSSRDFLRWFECQLEDGRTGRQRVLCDKGEILHGPCILCEPEVCDGEDNDCDNRIDEDPILCEDACGPGVGLCQDGELVECVNRDPAEEVCNHLDDDCDGMVDEGQRNACDECGEAPAEICDGIDNDCDDAIDEELVRECQTPCERGVESCIDGQWASCTAQIPVDEQCDGLDNDCDGLPDEGLNCVCTRDQVGVLFPCSEPPLICGMGFKTCMCQDVDCQLIEMTPCLSLCSFFPLEEGEECHPGLGQAQDEEICNNFDEDCDDLVDENITRVCYTGPPGTLNIGVCEAGEQTCQEGRWGAPDGGNIWTQNICGGETVPQEEICDGADNDCDGSVDYGEEMRPTDILLIVDTSGSMGGEIRAVTTALSRFGQHFSAEDMIHWGLIIGPTRNPNPDHPNSDLEVLTLVSNISPFQQFFADFINLDPREFDGGMEMLMDATMLALRNLSPQHVELDNRNWVRGIVSIPEKDNFVINWRPETDRIIIVFSDEDEQSYFHPPFHRNDVAAALANAPNTKLYTFAQAFYGWDELAIDSGGANFNLTSNSEEMYNNLMTILDEICLPRDNPEEQEEEQGAMSLPPLQYPVGYYAASMLTSSAMACY